MSAKPGLLPLEKAVPLSYEPGERPQVNPVFTRISWCILFAGCFVALLIAASRKAVVIANAPHEIEEESVAADELSLSGGFTLGIARTEEAELAGSIVIPLESGVRPNRISVENRYLDRILLVRIRNADADFYRGNTLLAGSGIFSAGGGAPDGIIGGVCSTSGSEVLLILQMSRVYAIYTTATLTEIEIRLTLPSDAPFVAVLDAEDETAAAVAGLVPELLEEDGIGVYLTYRDGGELSDEECREFLEEIGAQAYVRLVSEESADPSVYGIQVEYNSRYYWPGYGNRSLAEDLLRETVLASSNRALEAEEMPEEDFLARLTIPAARLTVGFRSNEAESALLAREAYRQKLAAGIAEALRHAGAELE